MGRKFSSEIIVLRPKARVKRRKLAALSQFKFGVRGHLLDHVLAAERGAVEEAQRSDERVDRRGPRPIR